MISATSAAAMNTEESILVRTIGFINMATGGTSTRRVAWIDQRNGNTRTFRLVFDFLSEVVKSPTMQDRALTTPSRYPFTNTLQILKGYPASGVFGGIYDLLRDNVVGIARKASFLARQAFQLAAGAVRLALLKFGSQAAVTDTHMLDALALMKLTVAGDGNIRYAQIDAKKLVYFNFRRFFYVACLVKVELPLAVDQITLATQSLKQIEVVLAADERHLLSSAHRPDTHLLWREFVGDEPFVERKRRQWLERALGFLVQFVGVGNFGKHAHCDIRAQAELLTDALIAQLVQRELPEHLSFPRPFTDIVASGVCCFKRSFEQGVLFGRWLQLELRDQFHTDNCTNTWYFSQP